MPDSPGYAYNVSINPRAGARKGESKKMKPTVYLARLNDGASPDEQARAAARVTEAAGFQDFLKKRDMVAVKVHVGEKNNTTHLRPEVVAAVVEAARKAKAEPFITDTSTLYRGRRENGIRHALHAHHHGFGSDAMGAPFIPLDGLAGTHEREVEINGELHQTVKVAGEIFMADALAVISHPTGHMGTGLGAAIKSVGMGLASRAGKMRQHSTIKPQVKPDDCTDCGKCRKWCPTQAISEKEGTSFIALDDCIGCGECIAVCRFGAIAYDYKIESVTLQKSMAEHAAGVVRHFAGKGLYMNVMVDMTKECDCWDQVQKKFVPDLGVIAGTDIVAVDQATLDITARAHGRDISIASHPHLDASVQIVHAEKMGMGNKDYALEEV